MPRPLYTGYVNSVLFTSAFRERKKDRKRKGKKRKKKKRKGQKCVELEKTPKKALSLDANIPKEKIPP